MFLPPHLSGYLIEQMKDAEYLRGAPKKNFKSQKNARNNKKTPHMVNLKGDGNLEALFFKFMGETESVPDSSDVRVPYGTNQR